MGGIRYILRYLRQIEFTRVVEAIGGPQIVDGLLAAENSPSDQYFIIPNSIINLRLNRVN